ncbi:SDR family oxidoreductase [Bailinhaonella thermotolerans]|uniref:SDR family oxidoreductase n=1 Tax=Bailinhaonella thermotolerans TaxID=1070861 RepID=A0A3A4ALD7_9ACTN|nr:SDR family oxidoreductase [Bailinhaonella thermotolerans]RJL26603.1 SDR family oxidoreductase [Bailinhaonella thermotolerans]
MNLFSVEGKSVVVTGGSRGIGLMIATGFAEAGARVYICSRKTDELERAAASIGVTAIPADLSTREGADRFAGEIAGREPKLDVLVNNAGAAWGAPLEDFPENGFDKIWNVNVKGVYYLTVAILPLLRKAAAPDDPARVINIGSVDGIRVPETENYPYAASKAAVHMLTRQLAHRLVKEHITVNAIAPGPFESKMMAFALATDELRQAVADFVPMGRIGRPEDMAGTAIYLASRAGSYLTGAVIPVDGGLSTHG